QDGVARHKAQLMQSVEAHIHTQDHRQNELVGFHDPGQACDLQRLLQERAEADLLQHGGYRQQAPIGRQVPSGKVERRASIDFIGLCARCGRALIGEGFGVMLLSVLHLLGDLLEIGSRSGNFAASLFYYRISGESKRSTALRYARPASIRCIIQVSYKTNEAAAPAAAPERSTAFMRYATRAKIRVTMAAGR